MDKYIYYNGNIITMDNSQMTAEALLTKGKNIAAIGSLKDLQAQEQDAVMVDLQGKTLLPSFIDSHSHITAFAQTLRLSQLGECKNIQEILKELKATADRSGVKKGEWLIGFAYDHNALEEKRHPNRQELDSFFPDNPVLISHISGHMGVFNTLALKEAGITADSSQPIGGKIGREQYGNIPNGYLEEIAFMEYAKIVPPPNKEEMKNSIEEGIKEYISYGISTIQDGLTDEASLALLKELAEEGRLAADVVAYLDMKKFDGLLDTNAELLNGYVGRLRIGGYKIFLDGSPQGKTAWLSAPYENEKDGYRGYGIYEDCEVTAFFREALAKNIQILVHCNGDEACEQMLRCFHYAKEEMPFGEAIRPVMIHSQLLRRDQLKRVKEEGIVLSYFIAHTYYWGDIHLQNLGQERANRISPLASTIAQGIPFTLHQDTPVLKPNMLEMIGCAVNRKTKSGKILGIEERISHFEALKAVTINAAYQYFEEDSKGSFVVGKLANMVILSESPLAAEKENLEKIAIEKVIRDGECIFDLHK